MKFKPFNRHLQVIPVIEEKEQEHLAIILPDEYKMPESPYVVCEVLEKSDDSDIKIEIGDTIIIERRMLHEINIGEETFYIVLQNYIYGRI